MYVYFLPDSDGIMATKEKKTDPRYKLIGEVCTTEDLAALLKDDQYMEDYAGEIGNTFAD